MPPPDLSVNIQDKHNTSSRQENPFVPNIITSATKNQPLQHTPHDRTSIITLNKHQKLNYTSFKASSKMLRTSQQRSSTLKTRNHINKRHSVMINPYDIEIGDGDKKETEGNNINGNLRINNYNSLHLKHRSKSLTSLTNFTEDESNSTIDSEEILKDIDYAKESTGADLINKDENYLLTVNNAFSDFSNRLNTIVHTNIDTDDSSDADSFVAVNKKLHPLRKLVINSPNSSSSTPKTRIISRSTTNTPLKRKSELIPSHSTSSTITLDPKLVNNNNRISSSESFNSNTMVERISEVTCRKSQCQIISNCIFFGPLNEILQSPTKPSETNASEVFQYKDDSASKRFHNSKVLTNFAAALVDPELFTKSAGSVFSGPTTFPSRKRTSLHFV
ncbi:hypothetical protein CANINC_000983 [Pichia inconspicua]|uniref:Uncharacterized protein n=1 Tax=Pichia inconspicua TaxID=52247 RepID=A0A4T0X647_9ASCO|nr:hypothetical protein CANINC_000983 [[Candida] inconspicua]